jgi:hypothetical protein
MSTTNGQAPKPAADVRRALREQIGAALTAVGAQVA